MGSTDSSSNPAAEDRVCMRKGKELLHEQKKGIPVGAEKLSHSAGPGGSLMLSSDEASSPGGGRPAALQTAVGRPCWRGPVQSCKE